MNSGNSWYSGAGGLTLLLVAIVAVFVLALGHLLYLRNWAGVDKVINEAVDESQLQPTVFRIFDKSSAETCDRLVHVLPMDWYVWACYGQLYILNPEGANVRCASGDTPAVRVLGIDNYVATCISANYDTLIRSYRTSAARVRVVPYELKSSTFTIFSALNLLVRDWLTFDVVRDTAALHSVRTVPSGSDAGNIRRKRSSARQVADMFSDQSATAAAADGYWMSPRVTKELLKERLMMALEARKGTYRIYNAKIRELAGKRLDHHAA